MQVRWWNLATRATRAPRGQPSLLGARPSGPVSTPPKACQRPVAVICAVSPACRYTQVAVAPQARTFTLTGPLPAHPFGGGVDGGVRGAASGLGTGGGAASGQGMSAPSICFPQVGPVPPSVMGSAAGAFEPPAPLG